jgi:hypothetical protein
MAAILAYPLGDYGMAHVDEMWLYNGRICRGKYAVVCGKRM